MLVWIILTLWRVLNVLKYLPGEIGFLMSFSVQDLNFTEEEMVLMIHDQYGSVTLWGVSLANGKTHLLNGPLLY